jgi:gas vesicle protein
MLCLVSKQFLGGFLICDFTLHKQPNHLHHLHHYPLNRLQTFLFFLPILTTILGLIGGILIARYSSYLTNQREKVKKEKERLDEVENMKMGAQILEAVSKSHSDLTNTINEQGGRFDQTILDQGSRLEKMIDDQGSKLEKAILDQGQRIESLQSTMEVSTIALAVLKNTVEERIPRRPIEIAQ